jgi:hypothetical protein
VLELSPDLSSKAPKFLYRTKWTQDEPDLRDLMLWKPRRDLKPPFTSIKQLAFNRSVTDGNFNGNVPA